MKSKISNPYFKSISNKDDVYSGKPATLLGIGTKLFYFFIVLAIGIGIYYCNIIPQEISIFALISAGALAIISSIVVSLAPRLSPIFGTIFSLSEGYIIAFLCVKYAKLYYGIVPISLAITSSVIIVMYVLYITGIVKVNQKFKAVIATMFMASIVMSLIVFISSFFTSALTDVFINNGFISIGLSAVLLLVSALNLAVDFDNIAKSVNNKYSKKYEWSLAFSLAMSVIFIFVRVLELLTKIMGNSEE